MKSKSTSKSILSKLLFEILSITFAVLLALGLNNWWENKRTRESSDNAMINIIEEVRENLKLLKANMEDNKLRITPLRATIDSLADYGVDHVQGAGIGYMHTLLKDAAWNTSNLSGVSQNFDLDIVMQLSDIYKLQALYSTMGREFFNSFLTVDYNDDNNTEALIKANLKLITLTGNTGTALEQLYEAFLVDKKVQQYEKSNSVK